MNLSPELVPLGLVFDSTGSYTPGLIAFAILPALAAQHAPGDGGAFFDTLCTFIALMLTGRWLQERVVEPVGVATALGEGTLARGEPLMVIRGPGAVHPTTAKALIATPPRLRMATATRLLPTLRSP